MRLFLFFILILNVYLVHSQSHPFLGEIDKPKEKDYAYSSSDYSPTRDIVDLSNLMPEVGDQGAKKSCWAWAVAYLLTGVDRKWNRLKSTESYSPEYIYQAYKPEGTGCNGKATAFEILEKTLDSGVLKKADFQVSESCDIPVSDYQKKDASKNKKPYYSIEWARGLKGIQFILEQRELPVLISLKVDDYFTSGKITRASPWWEKPSDNYVDHHTMVVVGFDTTKKALKVLNSHGKNFGDNGYVWISYSIIEDINHFNYACYLQKKSEGSAKEQETDTKSKSSLNSISTWFKQGYYRPFQNLKIVLAEFDPDKKFGLIEIRDQDYIFLKSFYIDTIGGYHVFRIGDQEYKFTLNNIARAGRLPTQAMYFTVEKL